MQEINDLLDEIRNHLKSVGGSIAVYASEAEGKDAISYSFITNTLDDFMINEIKVWDKKYNIVWETVEPDVEYYWDLGTWGDDFPYMKLKRVDSLTTFKI